ncbi:MAG: HDOD domain-containing protein, partial [Burkholderiaceae bacterium]
MATPEPLLRIRAALREDNALPALGQSVASVSKMASGESDTVDQLAQAILSDVSLTQRLLRCANSPLCRVKDAAPVTTVSRALVLLGFDQIKSLALSMLLVDRLVEGARARHVLRDFGQALSASSVARCTLQRCWPACAEEAAIGAMFRNVGRLIASVHEPAAVAAVRAKVLEGVAEGAAAKALIGRSYDELSLEVISGWGLPPRIQSALQPCPPRPVAPRSSLDWVTLASAFGDESAILERRFGPDARDKTVNALSRRFGDALGMDAEGILAILTQASRETVELAKALGLSSVIGELGHAADGVARTESGTSVDAPAAGAGGAPTGGEAASRSATDDRRLLSTLAKISEALADSRGTGRVVQIATEALCELLRAKRTVYFARDDAAGAYRPRAAAGTELAALRGRVSLPTQFAPTLFHAALARGADLNIADMTTDSVRTRLPDWLMPTFPDARSFLLLPVMVDGRPMGFFYADRD